MENYHLQYQTHDNNFNILRLIFATLVVFSHSYGLLAQVEPDIFGRSLGNWSVHGFFVISGYLICQSYFRSPRLISYSYNRFLRIVPALFVAIFLGKAIAFAGSGFKDNYVPYIINGPVWTLTWEVVCYIGLAFIGQLGILKSQTMPSFFGALWCIFLYNISSTSDSYLVIAPLIMMFLSGAFISVMEEKGNIGKFPWVACIGLLSVYDYDVFSSLYNCMINNVPFLYGPSITEEQVSRVIYLFSFPFVLIYVGKCTLFVISLKNDISYGIYIYSWPIAQFIVYLSLKFNVTMSALPFFILTLAISVPVSYFSWVFIEKPALKFKKISIFGVNSKI